jgi:hypothetical protein
MYRGRLYRSRLEARWAAFFDLLEWQHEYEPFDLAGWIPDFLLRGIGIRANGMEYPSHVLVEVKPTTEFHLSTAEKMERGRWSGNDACDDVHELLLVGVAPSLCRHQTLPGVQIGWIVGEGEQEGVIQSVDNHAIMKCFASPAGLMMDFADCGYPIGGILTGHDSRYDLLIRNRAYMPDLLENFQAPEISDRIMMLWAEATNRVQWRGKGRQP